MLRKVVPSLVALVGLAGPLFGQDRDVQSIVPQFEKVITAGLKKTRVPGVAVVIVHQDRVVYLKGFGVRKVGGEDAVDADTVFQLASVSKPFASTGLAALVGEGRIRWDDPVIKYMPEFRLADPWVTSKVTLRDLLSHRSGLPGFAGDTLEDLGYSRVDILGRLRFLKLSDFRATYAYTNFGFTAAAEAGARAVRKEWEEVMAEKVYRPLGMKSSSSRFADFEKVSNRATLHVRDGERMVARYVRKPDAQSPAGGVSASARDLGQWLRLQLADGKLDGKQIIAAEALRDTHRPIMTISVSPAGKSDFYGLGWMVVYDEDGRMYFKHSGGFSLGVRTEVTLLPKEQLGIGVLTAAFPTGLPEALSTSFFDLYLKGKVTQDWVPVWEERFAEYVKQMGWAARELSNRPKKPTPALPLERYVGRYRSDYYGVVEVRADGDKLTAQLGPAKVKLVLQHWDRDVFVFEAEGESGMGKHTATFRIGVDGRADQVSLESLSEYRGGTFTRADEKKDR